MRPPTANQLWIFAAALLWLLYAIVFTVTGILPLWRNLLTAAANVAPLVALAAGTYHLLNSHVMRRPVARQAIQHFAFAPIFAFTWYALIAVLLGFLNGARTGDFAPIGFSGPAASWQIFQGLIIYALVAATCYAIRGGRVAAPVTFVDQARMPMARYLVREEDGLRPIEVARIVSITGAQDYSEVSTLDGHHLVRMSLGEFERVLDKSQFIRVHRSAIISLGHLELAEPAGGGRMVARMADGAVISVSRSGAASLRERVAS